MPEPKADSDDAILKQLKDRYRYATQQWQPIRDAGSEGIRYVTGDPWTLEDLQLRQGRPVISADQLSQYGNQLINDVRQNPRAIKVSPGPGANKQTAELRANKIREIEYRSHAQLVYTTMFSNTVQRGYGFMAIRRQWASDKADLSAFNQELCLEPVVNPDLITPDPDALRPDGKDWRFLFEGEWMDTDAFRDSYPDAEIRDFDSDMIGTAPDWFRDSGRKILVCNYWVKKPVKRRLLLLKPPPPNLATLPPGQPVVPSLPKAVFADDLKRRGIDVKTIPEDQIVAEREVDGFQVCMYTSNGVEILGKEEWPGQSIPFVACYGKVEYVDKGSGSEKKLLSLFALALGLQKGYNYLQSTKFEAVGMTLKTPLMGYRGQATPAQKTALAKSLHEPTAFLEFEAFDPATGQAFPGLPERPPNELAAVLSALELSAESTRRDIQSAIGSNPLPTQAQRRNEKSGVALKEINAQEQRGSYHYVDHYEDAIKRGAEILDEMFPFVYDAARDIVTHDIEHNAKTVRINDPAKPYDDNPKEYPRFDVGSHDILISTGPSFDDERDEASSFVDTLFSSPVVLEVVGPEIAKKLLALAIRLKNIGHLGDQMADLLSPPEPEDGQTSPEQTKAQLAEASAKLQQLGQVLQQAQQEIATDAQKAKADIEKAHIAARKDVVIQRMRDATAIAVAKINALTKGVALDHEAEAEAIALAAEQQHEAIQNEADREHERQMASQEHQQALQQNEQVQDHALEQGAQTQEHTLESQQQAADLAPEPSEGA